MAAAPTSLFDWMQEKSLMSELIQQHLKREACLGTHAHSGTKSHSKGHFSIGGSVYLEP